jgi:hypothetical protein
MAYDFVEGDNSGYTGTCVDQDGAAINLTGKTVKAFWVFDDGTTHSAQVTVSDAVNGTITYTFTTSDLKKQLQAGTMKLEVEITTTATGAVLTTMTEYTYRVRARLNAGAG